MSLVTQADMRRFAPRASKTAVAALVDGDAALAKWGIATAPRLRMFMAQCKVESAGFAVLTENLNYTAARIRAVWPKRFASAAAAQRCAHNPEALADVVYGARMGNRAGTHDGWTYRGRGLLDLTGRANYEALAKHMGIDLEQVLSMLSASESMVECAAATFQMLGCLPFADKGDLINCTKQVNGGLIGLTDRRCALKLAAKIWPSIPPARPLAASHSTIAPSALPQQAPVKPLLRTSEPTSWFDQLFAAFSGRA